jgi:hypothetical protein
MRGGLGGIIGLRFDDAAAHILDEEADADEIACDIERTAAEEIRIEPGSRTLPAVSDWR